VPILTHPALKWSAKDPLPLLPVVTDASWQIIEKKGKQKKENKLKSEIETPDLQSGFIAAKGSVPVKSSKRKPEDEGLNPSDKKHKTSQIMVSSPDPSSPVGLRWDGQNYSCAYDAFFVVLYEIWSSDPRLWTEQFKEINQENIKSLSLGFKKYLNKKSTLEAVRDSVRKKLHAQIPTQFPYGTTGTSVGALASVILSSNKSVAISTPKCTKCEYTEPAMDDMLGFVLHENEEIPKSTSNWLTSLEHETHENCPRCSAALRQPIAFKAVPNLLVFEINSRNVKISKTIKFVQGDETVVLNIRGLIYYGEFHFTSRIIGSEGNVWYHDGMTTGSTCESEGNIERFSKKKLQTHKGKKVVLAVYAKV
jgi:hypothetical protein